MYAVSGHNKECIIIYFVTLIHSSRPPSYSSEERVQGFNMTKIP